LAVFSNHVSIISIYILHEGHAIAQADSCRLPTMAARVRVQAEPVVDKAALGQVFTEYFGFPYQSSFHQCLHHHNHLGLAQ
jgi:hypothetical protein